MQPEGIPSPEPPAASGSLIRRRTRSGTESWYAKWRIDGRQVMRLLGPVYSEITPYGLTEAQARFALQRSRPERAPAPSPQPDVAEAGRRLLSHLEALGRKKSTLMDYESTLRVHLVPFFGRRQLRHIDVELVELFIYAKQEEGKAAKSINNYLGLLHSIFGYGTKHGWCVTNPVALVDKPRNARNSDIRYLTLPELDVILAATSETPLGQTDRLVYLTAAMTGMRRGEVVALRWQDVDWHAKLIRVRRNFTRGDFGTPKSRRSSRSVPLAPRLEAELRAHYDKTRWRDASDLVFAHPDIGHVLDPSKLRKRFVSVARRAGVRPVRFHDLRHTFGTQMAAAGAPLRAVQEWLGHSDYRTTLIYADYALDPHQGARYAELAFSRRDSEIA